MVLHKKYDLQKKINKEPGTFTLYKFFCVFLNFMFNDSFL